MGSEMCIRDSYTRYTSPWLPSTLLGSRRRSQPASNQAARARAAHRPLMCGTPLDAPCDRDHDSHLNRITSTSHAREINGRVTTPSTKYQPSIHACLPTNHRRLPTGSVRAAHRSFFCAGTLWVDTLVSPGGTTPPAPMFRWDGRNFFSRRGCNVRCKTSRHESSKRVLFCIRLLNC